MSKVYEINIQNEKMNDNKFIGASSIPSRTKQSHLYRILMN